MEKKESNTIRTILRNEITWIIFIIGVLWGGVEGVVLPLQSVQIQISAIQTQLVNVQTLQNDVALIKQDHAVFKQQQSTQDSQIDSILKRLNLLQ